MTLDFGTVNWLAVVVGAAIYFILGAVWYSPVLFAKPWQAAIGWDESRAQPQTNPLTYVVPAVLYLIAGIAHGAAGCRDRDGHADGGYRPRSGHGRWVRARDGRRGGNVRSEQAEARAVVRHHDGVSPDRVRDPRRGHCHLAMNGAPGEAA